MVIYACKNIFALINGAISAVFLSCKASTAWHTVYSVYLRSIFRTPYWASNVANFSLAIIYYGIKTKFIGIVTHSYCYCYYYFSHLNIYERDTLCGFLPPMNCFNRKGFSLSTSEFSKINSFIHMPSPVRLWTALIRLTWIFHYLL